MRFVKNPKIRVALAFALAATAIPVLGQDSPKSILPPGFGDAPEEPKSASPTPPPSGHSEPGAASGSSSASSTKSVKAGNSVSAGSVSSATGLALPGEKTGEEGDEEIDIAAVLPDLPPSQRRSLDLIGVLGDDDGDMGIAAYGNTPGRYLTHLMSVLKAPIASRWASIALRRSLLSKVTTPSDVNGADFVAQRAHLLLRMGEAQSARQLVQAVDADRSTEFLRAVGLQAAMANADPGAMCPMVDYTPNTNKETRWRMARAVCFALTSEPAQASAMIDSVRDAGKVPTIDVLLAEKVIGAGGNSRRSVNILWEDVKDLNWWRFGMATSTAVPIPDPLLKTVGPQVRAWRASASLLPAPSRLDDAEIAAALGVYSSDGLVQAYAEVADATDPGNARGTSFTLLRDAFSAPTVQARLAAMVQFWDVKDPVVRYARIIATAKAANEIQAGSDSAGSADELIESMMSAGFDQQAVRWAKLADNGSLGQAILAVGAPITVIRLDAGDVSGFDPGSGGKRAQFLLAGLAGLGRMSPTEASDAATSLAVPIAKQDIWTRALDRAVERSEKGTVTLLVALGLQGQNWSQVPAHRLYRAVSAMHRVGLDGEARMIAAEALMRS